MAVAFKRGSTTGPSDLTITVRDTSNVLIDPFRLDYAIYDATTGLEILFGSPVNIPAHLSTGQYYAQVTIPADANIGSWRIRWTIQEHAADPVYQSVQEFAVVGDSMIVSFTGDTNFDGVLNSLRILLRDNNPDKNYSFRPPKSEKFIQGQTQVFGFIWEDEELLEYIYMAIDDFNGRGPMTDLKPQDLWTTYRRWRTTILIRAAAFACFAISMNWIADEFSLAPNELVTVYDKEGNDYTLSISELHGIVYEDMVKEVHARVQESIKEVDNEIKS